MSLNKIVQQIKQSNIKKQALDFKFANHFQNSYHIPSNQQYNSSLKAIKNYSYYNPTEQIQNSKHRYHKEILQDQLQDIKIFGYSSNQILQYFKKKQNAKNKQKSSPKHKSYKLQRRDSCMTHKMQNNFKPENKFLKFQRRVYHKLSLNQLQKAANTKNPFPNQLQKQYFTEQLFQFNQQGNKQNFRARCDQRFMTKQGFQQRQNGLKNMSKFCKQHENKSKITFQSTNTNFYSSSMGFKKQKNTTNKSQEQMLKDKLQKIKFNNNFQYQIQLLRKKVFPEQKQQEQAPFVEYEKKKLCQIQDEKKKANKHTQKYLISKQNLINQQNVLSHAFVSASDFVQDIEIVKRLSTLISTKPMFAQKVLKNIQKDLTELQKQNNLRNYQIFIIEIQTLKSISVKKLTIEKQMFRYKNSSFTVESLLKSTFTQNRNSIYHILISTQNAKTLVFEGIFAQRDVHYFEGRQNQIIFFTYYFKRFLAFDPHVKSFQQLQSNVSLLLQCEISIPIQFIQFGKSLTKNITIYSPSNSITVNLSNFLLEAYQTIILIKKQIYQGFNWRGISLKKEDSQFKTYNFQHFYI